MYSLLTNNKIYIKKFLTVINIYDIMYIARELVYTKKRKHSVRQS